MKKIIALVSALIIAFAMSTTVAHAAQGETCVPKAAYTEVVHHAAETHVVHYEAGSHVVHHAAETHVVHHAAVPSKWWNWSPNKTKKPFVGPPAFPTDPRGTWQGPHTNGGPKGTGTYQVGNGHGDWFHRDAGIAAYDETVVDKEAYDETVVDEAAHDEIVVDKAASTDVILHEAVKCDNKKPVVHKHTTFEPAPVPTTKPKHVVTPTLVHAGY